MLLCDQYRCVSIHFPSELGGCTSFIEGLTSRSLSHMQDLIRKPMQFGIVYSSIGIIRLSC